MTISRYMPFFRLVMLLKYGLYVPNGTRFEDKWDGLLGTKVRERSSKEKGTKYSHSSKDYQQTLKWIHVSCWYLGTNENFLMWKAYGGNGESVMIESTKKRLENLYRKSHELFFGYIDDVTYHQKGKEPVHIKQPSAIVPVGSKRPPIPQGMPSPELLMPELFSKYDHFDGEKECRLVFANKNYMNHQDEEPKAALTLKMNDPSEFITCIRVSPFAHDVVFDTVSLIAERYAPNVPVERSKIEINA